MRADLVERARSGDREAFGQLAAAEVDRLLAVARLILRDIDLSAGRRPSACCHGSRLTKPRWCSTHTV
jgi:hypothetical protein